jgi:hypothetical protein
MARVTVWPRRSVYGWERGNPPETVDGSAPERFPVADLVEALEAVYTSDAHFVPYSIPGGDVCPRINQGGLDVLQVHGGNVVFDSIPIDVDAPRDMSPGDVSPFCARQLVGLRDSAPELWETLGWYATRGGLRWIWLIDPTAPADYARLHARLRAHLSSLGVEGVDDRTGDVQRCYRLPFVVRDGEAQRRPIDLRRLGPLPTISDVEEVDDRPLASLFADVNTARIGAFELPDRIETGSRNGTLFRYASQLRGQGRDDEAILASLILTNAARCIEPLPMSDLRTIAGSVRRYDVDVAQVRRATADVIVIRKGILPELVDQAAKLLESGDLYQRAGEIVEVVREPAPSQSAYPGRAKIRLLDKHAIRVQLGRLAAWATRKKASQAHEEATGEEWIEVPADPPLEVVEGVISLGSWGLPALTGIVEAPTLRPDGSVIDSPGYDGATGLVFAAPRGLVWPTIPSEPTHADAERALAALREILVDFPFAAPAHESVAVAAILTALGRNAIAGSTPLFLFDSTTPGSGKGLLADVVSVLSTGRRAPVGVQAEPHEQEKRITAMLLEGRPLALIDNVDRPLGGSAIDAVITAEFWTGRRLGASEMVEVPNRAVWIATGNNVAVRGDLARRCLRVYLTPGVERPDERRGFVHADLLAWIRAQRGRLVMAALTLLRAYRVAAPTVVLSPFGGFGGWSGFVRSALVWLGMPDPCLTRDEIRESADPKIAALTAMLEAWGEIFGARHITVQGVIDTIQAQGFGGSGGAGRSDALEALRAALVELAGDNRGEINPRRVGWALRAAKGRILGGLFVDQAGSSRVGAAWTVRAAENVDLRLA